MEPNTSCCTNSSVGEAVLGVQFTPVKDFTSDRTGWSWKDFLGQEWIRATDTPARPNLEGDARLVNRPTQLDPWSERIDELLDIRGMEDDWDGMGAPAPSLPLVNSALLLAQFLRQSKCVPPCRIVAGVTGTVIIEWQNEGVYTELEVTAPRRGEGVRMVADQKTEAFEVKW